MNTNIPDNPTPTIQPAEGSDTGQARGDTHLLREIVREFLNVESIARSQVLLGRMRELLKFPDETERRCAELEAALKFIREEVGHEIVEGDFPDFTIAGYIDRALARPNAAVGEGK